MILSQPQRYSYADMLADNTEAQYEIISGEIVMMAPPSTRHQEISFELSGQFYNQLKGRNCQAFAAPFAVRLFEGAQDKPDDIDTIVQPDITVICDKNKIDGKGCKGAPDMVVEILSPSTRRYDMFTKLNLYARAGIKEYWIISPEQETVQLYVLKGEHYVITNVAEGGPVESQTVTGCIIDFDLVFPKANSADAER